MSRGCGQIPLAFLPIAEVLRLRAQQCGPSSCLLGRAAKTRPGSQGNSSVRLNWAGRWLIPHRSREFELKFYLPNLLVLDA